MDRVDCVVVGAGVVGLAVARALALAGREVLILEAEAAFGTATSARNSEVIHAGIYYPKGSLKGRLCVAGRRQLYDFCNSHGVAHRRCGKLIVATDEAQIAALEQLRRHALANGVDDLQYLDGREVLALEPEVQAVAGLLSPSTGIIDSHALMLALLGDAERHGAVLALNAPVTAITVGSAGLQVEVGGADPLQLLARTVVNCAGHGAPILAAHTAGLDPAARPRQFFAKGQLLQPERAHAVSPSGLSAARARRPRRAPDPGSGRPARFGPDVQWVEALDYRIEPERAEGFYAAIRRYWPALPDASLQPAYTGIRPKISGPAEAAADFASMARRSTASPGW